VEGFKSFIDMGALPIDSIKPVKKFLEKGILVSAKEKKIDSFNQNRLLIS